MSLPTHSASPYGNGESGDGAGSSSPTTQPNQPSRSNSLTTPQQVQETSVGALWTALFANACYLIGAGSFTVFSIFEFQHECPDFAAANASYLLGFAGFLISGFIELFMDVFLSDDIASLNRARYNSKRICMNIIISILFTVGNVVDLISFFVWDSKNFRLEHTLLFIASYTWLTTSVLTMFTTFDPTVFHDGDVVMRMDTLGNWLFLAGNIVDVVARHRSELQGCQEGTVYLLELMTSFLWFVNAVLFLGADVIRISLKKAIDLEERKQRGSPPASQGQPRPEAF